MENCFIENLTLTNFRNFHQTTIPFNSNYILIIGKNGSGKTSLLEAISLLFAGKGLRGSKFHEIISDTENLAQLDFNLRSYKGKLNLQISLEKDKSKRNIKLNGEKIPPKELRELAMPFWLTPQLNILFNEGQSTRRKYFDKITYIFNEEHASNLNKYEYYQRERLKIISEYNYDQEWASIIETKLKDLAYEICRARHNTKNLLNDKIEKFETNFPKIQINLNSEIDNIYINKNEEAFKEKVQNLFLRYRQQDAKAHKTFFGALKTEFSALYLKKNKNVAICSTGEQQASLITITIIVCELYIKKFSKKPILLLDELFVHLDEKNKEYLIDFLKNNEIQTFVTSTEAELCSKFSEMAEIVNL